MPEIKQFKLKERFQYRHCLGRHGMKVSRKSLEGESIIKIKLICRTALEKKLLNWSLLHSYKVQGSYISGGNEY